MKRPLKLLANSEMYDVIINELETEIEKQMKGCDHTFPDGRSSIEGTRRYRYCLLCDWNNREIP